MSASVRTSKCVNKRRVSDSVNGRVASLTARRKSTSLTPPKLFGFPLPGVMCFNLRANATDPATPRLSSSERTCFYNNSEEGDKQGKAVECEKRKLRGIPHTYQVLIPTSASTLLQKCFLTAQLDRNRMKIKPSCVKCGIIRREKARTIKLTRRLPIDLQIART